jgi:hypothetical protein
MGLQCVSIASISFITLAHNSVREKCLRGLHTVQNLSEQRDRLTTWLEDKELQYVFLVINANTIIAIWGRWHNPVLTFQNIGWLLSLFCGCEEKCTITGVKNFFVTLWCSLWYEWNCIKITRYVVTAPTTWNIINLQISICITK